MPNLKEQIFRDLQNFNYELPDNCPFCHHGIMPIFVIGYYYDNFSQTRYRLIFVCPREECQEIFIVSYRQDHHGGYSYPTLVGYAPSRFKREEFSDAILEISPSFVEIYNQAKQAENRNLHEICGLGYRKSLEFLIKDFLVKKYPDNEQEIKENHKLSNVINKYVEDNKVKFLAERASWLGNDHAHYIKKWVDKDINDLKRLISTTIYWISAEIELEHYMNEMG